MAVESPIKEADGWFAGEDKVLRFTVETLDPDIAGWGIRWTLHPRRGTETLLDKTIAAGVTITGVDLLEVHIDAADTATFDQGTYHYVLRRTDAGSAQVLAYGPAVLRRAEVA